MNFSRFLWVFILTSIMASCQVPEASSSNISTPSVKPPQQGITPSQPNTDAVANKSQIEFPKVWVLPQFTRSRWNESPKVVIFYTDSSSNNKEVWARNDEGSVFIPLLMRGDFLFFS